MYYAGIGSRSTPPPFQDIMTRCARALSSRGYTLRSGAADGADTAFARGSSLSQIFVPWADFGNAPLHPHPQEIIEFWTQEAEDIAAAHHPAWHRCSPWARMLHTRNVAQVLGPDLIEHSNFVLCWTPNASSSGGTGQAIRIAKAYDIPVYDLASSAQVKAFRESILD